MKYKVQYEYRGTVTVEIEATSKENAELLGLKEADEIILGSLTVYDCNVREVE